MAKHVSERYSSAINFAEDLRHFLTSSDADTPWASARIFRSRIRRNIKLAEAPSFGQSVFDYAPTCPGAKDYADLSKEVLAMAGAGTKDMTSEVAATASRELTPETSFGENKAA